MRRDGRAAETAVMRGVLHPQDRAASRRELVTRGPVRPAERALAPDLARGGMLLLIVLSNTGFHLWAASWGLGLGALLGSATMAAFAVGVWLVTVAGAYARHGHQSARWGTGYSMARRSRSSRLSHARRVRRAGSA
jgi:hypothetical protein